MTFKLSKSREGFIYFITARVSGGKHLFSLPAYTQIILDSLKWLRENKRIRLYAFVIMPNHLHFLAKVLNNFTAHNICFDFESFTAHQILKLLREENRQDLINLFQQKARNLRDRNHKIWQDIQAKECSSQKFILQKFEYIHNNPVRKNWNLAEHPADYKYSSACFYLLDSKDMPIIEIDNLFDYL